MEETHMAKAFEIEANNVEGSTTYIVIADSMQEAVDKTEKRIEEWKNAGHKTKTIKTVKLLGEDANVIA
jgi:biotin carboxylase